MPRLSPSQDESRSDPVGRFSSDNWIGPSNPSRRMTTISSGMSRHSARQWVWRQRCDPHFEVPYAWPNPQWRSLAAGCESAADRHSLDHFSYLQINQQAGRCTFHLPKEKLTENIWRTRIVRWPIISVMIGRNLNGLGMSLSSTHLGRLASHRPQLSA